MGNLKFGDNSTKNLGLVIQFKPGYSFPERDITIEHIPGRDGDLVIDNGCYQNVTRTYSVAAIFNPAEGFVQSATKIIEWLTKNKGYQRLEDTYEPEVFRLAMFNDKGTLQNIYDKATAFEINFNCKPQRFLKEGEEPIEFTGSQALLENPTEETAKPLISIRGLQGQADDSVLLASVLDKDGKATSLMTLSAIPSNNVHIDSELQNVYSDDKDLNSYVSLNGYSFPKLGKGETTIKVASYKESPSGVISAYNTLINNSKKVLYARYLPYQKIVESKQKSFSILPYDLLKQKYQEVYEAQAYASYCLNKAEEYTVTSINDVLPQYGYSFSVTGNASENLLPAWLVLSQAEGSKEMTLSINNTNDNFKNWIDEAYGSDIRSKISLLGVFIKNPLTKDIKFYSMGSTVSNGIKVSSTTAFEVYFAYGSSGSEILFIDHCMNDQTENGDKSLVNFPLWLGAILEYDNNSSRQVKKVTYKIVSSGFVYIEKSGLFGKSKWETVSNTGKNLDSMNWVSYKKAFISISGLSTDIHKSFTYRFLSQLPVYDDIYGNKVDSEGNVETDAMGNPIKIITNKVHFNYVATAPDSYQVTAKDAGYYRIENSDHESSQQDWEWRDVGNVIRNANTDGTKQNIIYYLENIPTYKDEENFPDWLKPTEVLPGNYSHVDINANVIKFKTNASGFYRCDYINPETGEVTPTDWSEHLISSEVTLTYELAHDSKNIIYYMQATEDVFPVKTYHYSDPDDPSITIDNVGFFTLDEHGEEIECNDSMPNWVKVNVHQPEGEEIVDSDKTLHFKTNSNVENALYKWDNNVEWVKHSSGYEMTESTYDQDTTVEFLEGYPVYSGESWQTLYDYEVITSENGNPINVKFTAKADGYYRSKDAANWLYMLANDEIVISKITEMTEIYTLAEDQEVDLSNVEITVIPRWWKL